MPDAAFRATADDDRSIARKLTAQNHRGRDSNQMRLVTVEVGLTPELVHAFEGLQAAPQDTFAEITVLTEEFEGLRRRADYLNLVSLANTWTAAFFWPLVPGAPPAPTQEWFATLQTNPAALEPAAADLVDEMTSTRRFFHFETAFLDVFTPERGGFDVVIGNPPYLGGPGISGALGDKVLKFLKVNHAASTGGRVDLAVYFLRRGFDCLR